MSEAVQNAPVLCEEIAVLLAKDAIEPVPPAEMRQGFYSPYFLVPKKGGGLRPILDLRVLNRALHKLPFKMLTHGRMIKCIQPQDWFAAIDLKDTYFHVSILPRHRPFLRFAFEWRAWQYRVLPFGLSLSPRVHEGRRRRPYPVMGGGHQDPQLYIRRPHPERQKLWAALCLPRRAAEREGCLQTEVSPLDSGGRRLGVPVARRAVPPGDEGSLH